MKITDNDKIIKLLFVKVNFLCKQSRLAGTTRQCFYFNKYTNILYTYNILTCLHYEYQLIIIFATVNLIQIELILPTYLLTNIFMLQFERSSFFAAIKKR